MDKQQKPRFYWIKRLSLCKQNLLSWLKRNKIYHFLKLEKGFNPKMKNKCLNSLTVIVKGPLNTLIPLTIQIILTYLHRGVCVTKLFHHSKCKIKGRPRRMPSIIQTAQQKCYQNIVESKRREVSSSSTQSLHSLTPALETSRNSLNQTTKSPQ